MKLSKIIIIVPQRRRRPSGRAPRRRAHFQRPGRLFYLYSVFCFISQSGPPPVEMAVVAVLGGDRLGIVAGISNVLARHNVNIVDISQTVARDIFSMINGRGHLKSRRRHLTAQEGAGGGGPEAGNYGRRLPHRRISVHAEDMRFEPGEIGEVLEMLLLGS